MKTFRTKDVREWSIDVNGETIARVESLTGTLLTDLVGGPAADEIAANPIRVLRLLYAACKPQADERKVDESSFLAQFNGDAMEEATDALITEVISFFPKSRRPMIQKINDKGREVQELAARKVLAELDATTAEQILEKLKDASPGEPSGNLPASSASTPPDSPSVA